MIKLTNINKHFKFGDSQAHILKDINLTINKGEFVAIVGPSGSGKSTLINIIGFLDHEFTGGYTFGETEIDQLKPRQFNTFRGQKVGFIFQNFKLIQNLSVYENIALPLLYAGEKKNVVHAKVQDVLAKVGLPNINKQLPNTLSGGQQQRVAIARALISQPKFIIADEPTGALDTKTAADIMELFQHINQLGTTIIMVTHDLNLAQQTNRIAQILDGQLIADYEVSNASN